MAKGGFEVAYVNNDKGTGDLVRDVVRIGGDGNEAIVIDGLQFGLVKETNIETGILGLGYSSGESDQPSLLDKLKSAGHIAARAYSLYLVILHPHWERSSGSVQREGKARMQDY